MLNRLFAVITLPLMLSVVGCGRGNQQEGFWSHFFGGVDTVTVRDTVTVDREVVLRDTVKIMLRDTVKVEKEIVLRDTVVVEKEPESIATYADEFTVFSGVDRLNIKVYLSEDAEDVISTQRARDRFEILLRGYGVPVSNFSYKNKGAIFYVNPDTMLNLVLDVVKGEDDLYHVYAYTTRVTFREEVIFYRDEKPNSIYATLWEDSYYGMAGSGRIEDVLLERIEAYAERVANLYLSANSR